jgi:hypothetical protein
VFRVWLGRVAALAAVLAALPFAPAHASAAQPGANPCGPGPATAQFGANTNRIGLIDLHFRNAEGAPVTYFECNGGRAQRLGTSSKAAGPITSLWSATSWRCGRRTRRFAAVATGADGSVARGRSSVRTLSCARRFAVGVRHRLARGQLARVRVLDRWRIGAITTRLCVTSPQGRRACRDIRFPKAASVATRRFRLTARGRWRVELRVRQYRVADSIAVGVQGSAPQAPPPTVLATGDSTMQGIDTFLTDDLGDTATVVSDVRPGFAISKANGWAPIAAAQAASLRPRTTVVSIGAAEGFPMRVADGSRHACCDAAWVGEYSRRVRATIRAYLRHGRVFWLTLPAPREAKAVPIFAAVNAAILRAAEGLVGVRVLRMDLLFTPAGYRDVIRYRGRQVRVREPDGVHLNVSGAAIAGRAVTKALRER